MQTSWQMERMSRRIGKAIAKLRIWNHITTCNDAGFHVLLRQFVSIPFFALTHIHNIFLSFIVSLFILRSVQFIATKNVPELNINRCDYVTLASDRWFIEYTYFANINNKTLRFHCCCGHDISLPFFLFSFVFNTSAIAMQQPLSYSVGPGMCCWPVSISCNFPRIRVVFWYYFI